MFCLRVRAFVAKKRDKNPVAKSHAAEPGVVECLARY